MTSASYFAPRRLGHVNLWVDDLAASESFYRDVSGLRVEFTEPDLVATFLGTGHTPHDLGMIEVTRGKDRFGRNGILQLPGTIGLSPGLNHLAWELENEAALVTAFKHLRKDGVKTDLTVDHQVAHSVYIFDPDGNYNEYYCDTIRDWRSVLGGPMELLTEFWDPMTAEGSTEQLFETAPTLLTTPGAPVNPWRVTHSVLRTADIEQLTQFYTRIGGLAVIASHEAFGWKVTYLRATLDTYPHCLILLEAKDKGYGRACFELESEAGLEVAKANLAAKGVPVLASVDLPWKTAIFLEDPDGLVSEYYVRRDAVFDPATTSPAWLEFAV